MQLGEYDLDPLSLPWFAGIQEELKMVEYCGNEERALAVILSMIMGLWSQNSILYHKESLQRGRVRPGLSTDAVAQGEGDSVS